MVGGALKLASNVFNPDTELSDIKSMRRELQSTMTDISSDLKSIDSGIDTLKTIATETYEMVVDLKHKEGLDLIDSNYDVFLKGLRNHEKAHSRFSGFIIELETKASLSFKKQNVRELLTKVAKTRGKMHAKQMATYVFIVRAKYLQIITAFYLYDNDRERVEDEFKCFNNDVKQLQEIHKELFAEEFQPREPLAWELVGRKVPCVAEWCSDYIPLNEMIDHVNAKHGGKKSKVDSNGLMSITWGNKDFNNENNYWTVTHADFSGHTFIPRITKKDGIYYLYTKILADNDAASKFKVDIEAKNMKNNLSLKLPGAKVYPMDMKWQDVIEDEDGVLSFDMYMAKKLFELSEVFKYHRFSHKTTIKQI